MGFDFSRYGTPDDKEDTPEEAVPEKKPRQPSKPKEPARVEVSEEMVLTTMMKYWPPEFKKFLDEHERKMEEFQDEIRGMLEVRDETLVDVWNEVWPSLQKMWKGGVFRGRLEKINQLIHDKIS